MRRAGIIGLFSAVLLTLALALSFSFIMASSHGGSGSASDQNIHDYQTHEVTLISGHTVVIYEDEDEATGYAVASTDTGSQDNIQIVSDENGTYVVPDGVDLSKLDIRLFDIDYLLHDGYPELGDLPVIVELTDESNIAPVGAAVEDTGGRVTFEFPTLSMLAAHIPGPSIKNVSAALVDDPGVKKVWLDARVYADLEVSVPLVGAPDVWAGGFRGEGMIIAVLDTGIDATHVDLDDLDDNPATTDPKVLRSVDCTGVGSPDPALCTEKVPGNDDPNGHGSHVSGIASGTGQASGGSRSGVAPGAFLWNVRVLNAGGSGFNSWIIAGILTASLGPDGVAGTDDEAHVINMSLGGGPTDGTDPLAMATDDAVERGVLVATSAGNSGPGMGTVGTPGSARKAFTVGATDDSDQMASFSSRGPISDLRLKPDITAPGVGTLAPDAGSGTGYVSLSGTSMSSPHVAGAAALVRQVNPDWSPEQVKAALMNNALVLNGPRLWDQGAGRLRVPEAVFTPLVATPPSFSFGQIGGVSVAETTGTLTVENVSDAELTVNLSAVTTLDGVPSDIVSVDPTTLVIPVDGSGDATVTVTPGSGDGPGMYEGRVIITELGALASGDERTVPYLFVLETFPDIGVAPSSFDETIVLQELRTGTMTINNTGTGPLNFIVGAVETGSSGDTITILETQTRSVSASNQGAVDEVTVASYILGTLTEGPAILVYTDDYVEGPGTTFVEQALIALGLPATVFYGDYDGFGAALAAGPSALAVWDLVIVSHNNFFELGNYWVELEAYYNGGGKLLIETFDIDGSHSEATTLWDTLGVQQHGHYNRHIQDVSDETPKDNEKRLLQVVTPACTCHFGTVRGVGHLRHVDSPG